MERVLVIPAAGRGSRLHAEQPKALVPVAGRPMLEHLLAMHRGRVTRFVIVIAPVALEQFRQYVRTRDEVIGLAVQDTPTGMLDAILASRPHIISNPPERILITWCDQIAVSTATTERLAARAGASNAPALVFPTITVNHPYIHFERDSVGRIVDVLQRREGDPMPEHGESDMGLFDLSVSTFVGDLTEFASALGPAGGTGERNFLPFIPWLASRRIVETVPGTSAIETVGVNTPDELARVQEHLTKLGDASR
jgi:bifunctional UDP-N-acetylglucosamine pyrophosphorylase/glucosamine-1-phosphate N-acetyltransferase